MMIVQDTVYIIDALKSGQIGVLPSDTVYGLMASAYDKAAVERLYALKHREHKPGTLIAASIEQFALLGIKKRYLKAVESYWPGSISIIVPSGYELEYLHQGKVSLAVRIPDNDFMKTILNETGPLLTTSANHPGEPTANTIDQAIQVFGSSVDFYVDGGDLSANKPSTVIRIIDDAIEIVRQGAVEINENGSIHKI